MRVTERPRDSKDRGKRGGGDSLTEGRHHTTGDEDEFGHVQDGMLGTREMENEIIEVS
jgi:hypothetical protein